MQDWGAVAALVRAIHGVADGPLTELGRRLPKAMAPSRPSVTTSNTAPTAGIGSWVEVIAWLTAQHADGRALSWEVALQIFGHEDGRWSASVKAEIDLADDEKDEHCVMNEQRDVGTAVEAVEAIREYGRLVASYPLDELLALRWSAVERPLDYGASPWATVTLRVSAAPKGAGPTK